MEQLISFFVVCTSVFISSQEAEQACGPNELLNEDIYCKSDCCPGENCPDNCATACKCYLMYHRVSNGTCISTRDCPPITCPENEYYDSCPVCNESCENAKASGQRCEPNNKTTVICEPACRCNDNYWRDEEKKCVYYEECPQFQDANRECQSN